MKNRKVKKAAYYYFSPTGGTKKVGELFCRAVAEETVAVDLAVCQEKKTEKDADLAVLAAPVFAGRIPGFATEQIKQLHLKGMDVVTLAVYGNRAYEDALLELNDTAASLQATVIGSGAFVACHSMMREVAAGRPDVKDEEEIQAFAEAILKKLQSEDKTACVVPGNHPYKEAPNREVTPISLDNCTGCGTCAKVCPTQAITVEHGKVKTEVAPCIFCMACVAACPEHARILPPPMAEKIEALLGPLKEVRNKNEVFY